MKNTTLGLVGVGRIGVMHAQHLTALAETLHPRGINVRLVLTDVAAEHARTVAGQLGARSVPSVDELSGRGSTDWSSPRARPPTRSSSRPLWTRESRCSERSRWA